MSTETPIPTDRSVQPHQISMVSALSYREFDVLEFASRGLSLHETAARLEYEVGTIKNCRSGIYKKIDAANIGHAVRIACEADLFIDRLPFAIMGEPSPTLVETFNLFSLGHDMHEVASILGIKYRAAQVRKNRLIQTIGAQTFPHAVRITWESRLIPPRIRHLK